MSTYELINGGDHNPYHLLIYMIANFITADCNKPLTYYYPKSESKLAEEMLAMLPAHFTRHYERVAGLEYKPFMHVKPWFPDWTMPQDYDFLRQLFAPHMQTRRPGLRIYISRRDAESRRVVNEDRLLEVLVAMNFIPITMTGLTVKEQIAVFSQADILVAPHGAALTYMTFMDRGATVVELNGPTGGKRHYSHIAWHLDLDFYKLPCKSVGDKEDMEVDVERLVGFLKGHPKLA